jgi:hypothetical protein
MKKYLFILVAVFLGVYGLTNASLNNPAPITSTVITTGTINYATSSTQTVFTNNTSKNFMITSISAETLTATNVTLEPQATLQTNGGSWDVVDVASLDTAIVSGSASQIKNVDVAAASTYPVVPGDSMTLNVVAGTADAYTGRIIISGVYY